MHGPQTSALTAIKRLADTTSDDAGAEAEAEALELERLRRDLSLMKVQLADSEAQRDEAQHALRRERESRPKSRSWFGSSSASAVEIK